MLLEHSTLHRIVELNDSVTTMAVGSTEIEKEDATADVRVSNQIQKAINFHRALEEALKQREDEGELHMST